MAKKKLVGACLLAQSGGPTAVINASAAGVFLEALNNDCITNVYAAAYGVAGILGDEIYDIGQEDLSELELLKNTPSSALGSARYKLKDFGTDSREYERILEVFRKYNIRYFFFNGGNDSMDTCNKISKYMKSEGYECRIIGIPKTVDNDLMFTDHCPGYGSAARYIATTMMEIGLDARVYDITSVTVVEIMGRNAGWLTAAASLAGESKPDLIYLPEIPFSTSKFIADVGKVLKKKRNCLIAISEGLRTREGQYITDMTAGVDHFGHTQLGGAGEFLEDIVRREFGCKCRSIEFSLMQRSAAHLASQTDIDEAFEAGRMAVKWAVKGESDKMVILVRDQDEKGQYKCRYELAELAYIANIEKKFPREWISEDGTAIMPAYFEYAMPLIQGVPELRYENSLPRFARLKKVRAK